MSIAPLQPNVPVHLMPAPPSWVRPTQEKTAPAQETQRDGDRQNSREERRLRNLPVPGGQAQDNVPSQEELKRIAELRARDAEVRAHERAHQAAGGDLAGAASYEEVRGPDGRMYAIGGEVPIDAAPEAEPEETIAKMERVKRAALAPAEPSAQDRAVAAQAEAQAAAARAELARQQREEANTAYGKALGYGQPADDPADRIDLVA